MPTLAEVLNDAFLRRHAGTRTYQRGREYFEIGRVKTITRGNESFTAVVVGQHNYEVFIASGRTGLEYECDCPMGHDGDFCKHCVAASLAWMKTPAPKTKPKSAEITLADAARYLTAEPQASVVRMLVEWAEDDDRLRDRLLQFAARRTGPEAAIATARAAFDRAAEWLDDDLDDAIAAFQELLNDGHAAAVVDLCEHAIRTLDRDAEMVHDDGDIMVLIDRLLELHLDACAQVPPDPIQLALRLFHLELDSQTSAFSHTPEDYKDLLGPAGLIAFKKLVEQPHFAGDHRVTAMRESIARATGDVDTLVEIFSKDLANPYRYRQIVETLLNAGRYDDALSWIERSLHRSPTDAAMREFAANEYHRRNDHPKAMKLMWSAYQESLSVQSYETLRQHAEQAGEWPEWRDNAIGLIRRVIAEQKKKGPADHSRLVAIFLHEGKIEEAWREAQLGGCTGHQWFELAQKREKDHPGDAIPIYFRQAEDEIQQTRNGDYTNPVALLIKTAKLMKSIGATAEFERQLAALRAKYKAKRNFIKLLDRTFPVRNSLGRA